MINIKRCIIGLSIVVSLFINSANAVDAPTTSTVAPVSKVLNTAPQALAPAPAAAETAVAVQPSAAAISNPQQGSPVNTTTAANSPNESIIVLQLATGDVVIELNPLKAPEHVKRIKELVRKGFYNGVPFHRVIDGFMAQTGDPTGTGMGKSDMHDLKAEFNDTKHVRGVVSMARSSMPDSANSQFFIMLAEAPSLNAQYSAFGKVILGMEFVDKIKKGDSMSGKVADPVDKIVSMKVAADIPGFVLPGFASAVTPATTPAAINPSATVVAPVAPKPTDKN